MRQIIGNRNVLAVARDRDVAGVDARAHFRQHGQRPQIVFADPTIARHEEHVAAIRGEFRPPMQGEPGRKARQRLEPIAVKDRRMMVACLDDDKEIQRVGIEARTIERGRGRMHDPAGVDLLRAPDRRGRQRRGNIAGERGNLLLAEFAGKAWHLRRRAAVGNHRCGLDAHHATQVLRQQRRPQPAEPVRAMTRGAVVGIKPGGVRRCRCRSGQPEPHQQSTAQLKEKAALHVVLRDRCWS